MMRSSCPKNNTLPGQLYADSGKWAEYTIREIAAETGRDYREVVNAIHYLKSRYDIAIPHSDITTGKYLALNTESRCMACSHYSIRNKCCKYMLDTGCSRQIKDRKKCWHFDRVGAPVFVCWPKTNQYSLLFVLTPHRIPYERQEGEIAMIYECSNGQLSLLEEFKEGTESE